MTPEQVLAFVVYEIRRLLADHLGSQSDSGMQVRMAAHLAYALHNEAEAVLRGGTFDPEHVGASLGAVDRMLGSDLEARFAQAAASVK